MASAGTLYIVATPLGNLGDLTARAVEILRQVPIVAAEDTRRTRGLLNHLEAHPKLLSFHAHSEPRRQEILLEHLREGHDVALVSDAGTPVVSDPGAELVAAVRQAGLTVVPIPGASAVATALSASGLTGDRYLFLGFVPRKGTERARLLERAMQEEWTTVFYEAPTRLAALLTDLAAHHPVRRAVVARELTKMHEEFRTGTLEALAAYYQESPPRGEITVMVAGADARPEPLDRTAEAVSMAGELLAEGMSRKEAVRRLVDSLGIPRNQAYRMVMDLP